MFHKFFLLSVSQGKATKKNILNLNDTQENLLRRHFLLTSLVGRHRHHSCLSISSNFRESNEEGIK